MGLNRQVQIYAQAAYFLKVRYYQSVFQLGQRVQLRTSECLLSVQNQ